MYNLPFKIYLIIDGITIIHETEIKIPKVEIKG